MIDRYSLPEMAAVFSDTTRFGRYLEIELSDGCAIQVGIVPPRCAAGRATPRVSDDASWGRQ